MTVKKVLKIVVPLLVLIAGYLIGFNIMFNKYLNEHSDNLVKNLPGPELKVGRYYVDGNTEQFYLDISDDGTLWLKDVDYFEFESYGNENSLKTRTGKDLEETIANLQERADKMSKPIKYRSVFYPDVNSTAIFTSWAEDEFGNISGTGYTYVDENTIKQGNVNIFIFVEEDLWQKAENDGYYTVNDIPIDKAEYTPTRIVDSLTYKKNHGISTTIIYETQGGK